jgi:hypothetical protein
VFLHTLTQITGSGTSIRLRKHSFKPFALYQTSCTSTTPVSSDRRKIKHRESDITLTFNEGKLSQFVMEDKRELMI